MSQETEHQFLAVLESEFCRAVATGAAERDRFISRFGFSVPDRRAIEKIAQSSPNGVVEIGAGTGAWARALHDAGLDVEAFDLHPPPSQENYWFAGSDPWFPVQRADHLVVERFATRTLLLAWPTRTEIWAAEALEVYHRAGGKCVAYVGEEPGGRTGDEVFQARLGHLSRCAQCAYGITTVPCICGIDALWNRIGTVPLVTWPGFSDALHLYEPTSGSDANRPVSLSSRVTRVFSRFGRRGRGTPARDGTGWSTRPYSE